MTWHTPESIAVKPLYTAEDINNLPYTNTFPGLEPFIRGPQATMYAGKPWTIRALSKLECKVIAGGTTPYNAAQQLMDML